MRICTVILKLAIIRFILESGVTNNRFGPDGVHDLKPFYILRAWGYFRDTFLQILKHFLQILTLFYKF